MAEACKCGNSREATYSTEGAIGRGTRETGTETEEHYAYWCEKHGENAPELLREALAERDGDDKPGFLRYGPWEVLELKLHDLAAHDAAPEDDSDDETPPCPEECETLVG